jgi:cobalamin-dependent methionine synthase I
MKDGSKFVSVPIILVDSGLPAEDHFFDPNIFPVATGMDEHKLNALFFRATKWIRESHVQCKWRVSNVSFHLEEMIRCGSNAFCFLVSCDSKRNDDGNRKSRNAVYL